ncbi:unnamed protein product, partial [marine sediment metagenome]
MNEVDLAYAAGLFDGEGCISISRKQRGRYFDLICRVGICDKEVPTLLQKQFGGSVYESHRDGLKTSWQWTVCSKNALSFLEAVCGHLRIKKP